MVEDNEPLVIDIGSGTLKAGFAPDDAPKYLIPMVVGIPRSKGILVGMDQKDAYIGQEAKDKKQYMNMHFPVQKGVIHEMEHITQILSHLIDNELRISMEEHACMMTEPPGNPKSVREETMQMMFETFKVPQFYLGNQAVLSLFATGRTTGTVLDSGEGVTHTVPIYEGYAIPHAITTIPICGRDLTDYMLKLLQAKDPTNPLNTTDDWQQAEDYKINYGHVALDFDAELKSAGEGSETYQLPSGGPKININKERLQCPELLFNPQNNNISDAKGIHNYTFDSIMKCDNDIKKDLFKNIVLAGGCTMFQGMQDRMRKEIQALAPSPMAPQVETPADRKYSCWLGGAILSMIEKFGPMWITYKEYAEKGGPKLVHEKCF